MFRLSGHGRNMPLTRRSFFLGRWLRRDPSVPAVIAHAVDGRVVDHRGVVNVVNVGDVDIVHRAVVVEVSVLPAPALIAVAEVAEAVVNPAIKPDHRAPIADMEDEPAAAPSPPAGRPVITGYGNQDPRSRDPVIVAKIGVPR